MRIASPPSPRPPPLPSPQAYGPTGLGILTVAGIPGLPSARAALLPLAHALNALPAPVLAACEDPPSRFNFGYSRGKEVLSDGRPDTAKASFYANPLVDGRPPSAAAAAAFPTVARPNVWPDDALPALRPAFVGLGRLLAGVGVLVARACDAVAARKGGSAAPPPSPSLASLIEGGDAAKGRLLYYFPPEEEGEGEGEGAGAAAAAPSASPPADGWCGWHADHGLLTALTRPLYVDATTGVEVEAPEAAAGGAEGEGDDAPPGLYVRRRGAPPTAPPVRVVIPPGHAAFQAGEAAQVASGGRIVATPHCVRAPRGGTGADGARRGAARATFALFLQPRWDAPLAPPPGVSPAAVGVARWRAGDTFGAFSERTADAYYG